MSANRTSSHDDHALPDGCSRMGTRTSHPNTNLDSLWNLRSLWGTTTCATPRRSIFPNEASRPLSVPSEGGCCASTGNDEWVADGRGSVFTAAADFPLAMAHVKRPRLLSRVPSTATACPYDVDSR
ncbi:hypothetical protein MRX96_058270 [Rhipicephalus microplus]